MALRTIGSSVALCIALSLGVHGALLPLILMPVGIWLATALAIFHVDLSLAAAAAPIAMGVYYLLWKHAVGFLNSDLGIA